MDGKNNGCFNFLSKFTSVKEGKTEIRDEFKNLIVSDRYLNKYLLLSFTVIRMELRIYIAFVY